jgi:heme A synthase
MDTYGLANLFLSFASIINFVALLLMLRAVIKNRKVLRGYSILGSFLTFVSIVGFEIAYYLLGNIVGFAFGWATVAFWFVAFLYSLRQRLKGTEEQKKMVET